MYVAVLVIVLCWFMWYVACSKEAGFRVWNSSIGFIYDGPITEDVSRLCLQQL